MKKLLLTVALVVIAITQANAATLPQTLNWSGTLSSNTFSGSCTITQSSYDYANSHWLVQIDMHRLTGNANPCIFHFTSSGFTSGGTIDISVNQTIDTVATYPASPGGSVTCNFFGGLQGGANGTAVSVTITIPAAPPLRKKFTAKWVNPYDTPITVTSTEAGVPTHIYGSITVAPHSMGLIETVVADGKDVTQRIQGTDPSTGPFVFAFTTLNGGMTTITQNQSGLDDAGQVTVPAQGATVTVDPTTPAAMVAAQSNGGASVTATTGINPAIFNSTQTASTAALQGGQFMAGINGLAGVIGAANQAQITDADANTAKITAAIAAIPGAGNSGIGDTLTNTDFNSNFASTKTLSDYQATGKTAHDTYDASDIGGVAGGHQADGSAGIHSSYDTALSISEYDVSPPDFTIPIAASSTTSLAGSGDAHVMPWDVTMMGEIATVIKAIIAWCFAIWYIIQVVKGMERLVHGMTAVHQTIGNTVAGTGGQLSAGIGAAFITGALLAAPVTFAAIADSGLGWHSVTSFTAMLVSHGVLGTNVAAVFQAYIPLGTITATLVGWVTLVVGGGAILQGVNLFVRWIVPIVVFGLAVGMASKARADVTFHVLNGSAVDTSFNASSLDGAVSHTFSVPAGTTGTFSFAPTGRTAFVLSQDGVGVHEGAAVEILDNGVCTFGGGSLSVVHPASVWWDYFAMGFRVGMIFELFGVMWRSYRALAASRETT